jgi:hypothetical protein
LGENGTQDEFDVRLRVTFGWVTVEQTRTVIFVKAGVC